MAKKTNLLQHLQRQLPDMPSEQEASLDYYIPAIVKQWGQLVGTSATEPLVLEDEYLDLAVRLARLLEFLSITEISEEAVESVSKRWAVNVSPWVAVGNRVTALHDAWRQDNIEDIGYVAQKLWAALDARSVAITGHAFAEVVR